MNIARNARTVPAGDVPSATPTIAPARSHKRRIGLTAYLTADQFVRLLAVIDDAGGIATIDAISRALPRVAQPVSAVFDLCDAGILNVDWDAAFDGDMRVWHVDRRGAVPYDPVEAGVGDRMPIRPVDHLT